VDAVKRVGEVVRQGSAAVIVRVPGRGYCACMGDDWRVCIAFGVLPGSRHSFRRALIPAVGSCLGDQVTVSSSATRIFLYAPSIGLADEAAQVAHEVLAQHDINAPVRTEHWSHREQKWQDAADDPPADPAAQQQADRQEAERKRSVMTGVPAWQVRVEMPSHSDVIALADHLAAQGWRVRRHPKSLIISANCEDDAKGLGRALSGDGRADTDPAFRVGRVSYRYMYNETPIF
jgi:hypothetical protein